MLRLDNISKVYKVGTFGGQELTAVRDVSFDVPPGRVVSLIGESGSGKSTIGKMVLKLIPVTRGSILFQGTDITAHRGYRKRKEYYRQVQGVFQDPFSTYNPIFKADRVFEMVRAEYFPKVAEADWRRKLEDALEGVRLDPGMVLNKYPHQLSGGQLQRMLLARALLLDVKFLVADEIISMLDASTRIDVLNLLADLKARGLGILFVTHDLALGNYVSDRTVIMKEGRAVEVGRTDLVFANPVHPYTQRLLSSVPQLHKTWSQVDAELAAQRERSVEAAYVDLVQDRADGAAYVEVEEDHFVSPVVEESEPVGIVV